MADYTNMNREVYAQTDNGPDYDLDPSSSRRHAAQTAPTNAKNCGRRCPESGYCSTWRYNNDQHKREEEDSCCLASLSVVFIVFLIIIIFSSLSHVGYYDDDRVHDAFRRKEVWWCTHCEPQDKGCFTRCWHEG